MQHNLNYASNTYIAISLSPSSPYLSSPSNLALLHPSLSHVGQVGAMPDVQLLSVPKSSENETGGNEAGDQAVKEILKVLEKAEGVKRVDVQVEKRRVKKGGEEL